MNNVKPFNSLINNNMQHILCRNKQNSTTFVSLLYWSKVLFIITLTL